MVPCATATTRAPASRTRFSLGGFSAEEFVTLVETVSKAIPAGDIAPSSSTCPATTSTSTSPAIIEDVLVSAVPCSQHPVTLTLSLDYDHLAHARLAKRHGVAALTAINTVKALRLWLRSGADQRPARRISAALH